MGKRQQLKNGAGPKKLRPIDSYVLVVGLIVCGVISSPYVFDPTLVVRHAAWCVVTLILCAFFLLRVKKNINVLNTTLFSVFAGYCLMTTISICKAANTSESLNAILICWVTLFFFVCAASKADKKTVIKAMVWFGLFLAICGLYDIAKVLLDGKTIKETYGLGFTCGRNLWSSTLLLLMPFSLYSVFKDKSKIAGLTLVLLLVNIILLQTRSVYLALFAATAVTLWNYKKRAVIPLFAATIICACIFPRLRYYSSLECRFTSWGRSIKTFRDEPILGVGAGNWKLAVPRYGNTYTGKNGDFEAYHQRAHNDFIEVFVETGVIGGLCYAAIFAGALYYTRRLRDKTLAWTMRFGLVNYMVFAFFSFPKERAIHSMLVFTMIALIVREYHMRKVWSEKRCVRTFAVCAATLFFALFVDYQRYRTGAYCVKMVMAKSKRDWKEVVRIIDENYTPFSTMLSYAVTPIYQYKAEANFYLGNHDEAFRDYLVTNKLHPNHPSSLFNLGFYNYSKKRYKRALYYYAKAEKIFPADFVTMAVEKTKRAIERTNYGR